MVDRMQQGVKEFNQHLVALHAGTCSEEGEQDAREASSGVKKGRLVP